MSRMWGNAAAAPLAGAGSPLPSGLPSMLVPTLDPKELDKRINDLRSVENWLDMNRALLHTTIQTLEMQRNAIVALQSMAMSAQAGATAAVRGADAPPETQGAAPPPAGSAPAGQPLPFNPAQWWNALGEQFARVASAAVAEAAPEADQGPDPAAPPHGSEDARPRSAAQAPPSAGGRPGRKGPGQ